MSSSDMARSYPARDATVAGMGGGRVWVFGLAALLIAFTLSTMDGGETSVQILSAVFFVGAAAYLMSSRARAIFWKPPLLFLSGISVYAVLQTLLLREKATYEAWNGVFFWLTAALIALIAAQLFRSLHLASLFRHIFVIFGSGLCVLELLEQASNTSHYFWIIPSKYQAVYGSFAYWNNFAEFVELLLPVTLWMGLSKKRPDLPYLFLAAVQIGAVAASGSRAGAALVLVELVGSFVIFSLKNRNLTFLYAALATVLLVGAFIYSAGVSAVMQKLHQQDQLSVRKEVNASSLAMVAERPFAGWGMNSYVPVYPRFALYDAGNIVNRAHNDWLQWAAEGGVFFAVLMLAVCIWSVRPAVRSVWGIGLLVVCLHALVDYPFARLGVCGWYFALLGMLSVWRSDGERRSKRLSG